MNTFKQYLAEADSISYRELKGPELYYDLFHEPENKDIGKRIKYLSHGSDQHDEHDFVALDGKKVVGVLGIWESSSEKRVVVVPFVSVDPSYKGKGVARKLIEMLFKYAKKNSLRVRSSTYTTEGAGTIKSSMERLSNKYDVPFKDSTDHYKFDL